MSGDTTERVEDNGAVWMREPGAEFFTTTNEAGDVIRARRSDLIPDDDEEDRPVSGDTNTPDPAEVEFEEPTPSRAERLRDLGRRAKEAQDRLGWANPTDVHEVTHAAVDLARVVTDLTTEVTALRSLDALSTTRTQWGVRWPGEPEDVEGDLPPGMAADGGRAYALRVSRQYSDAQLVRCEVRVGPWTPVDGEARDA